MNEAEKEERIRARAYALWEQQGRPEGRQSENWEQARREIEQEDAESLRSTVTDTIGLAVGAEPDQPKPRRAKPSQKQPAEGDRGTVNRELARQGEPSQKQSKARTKTPSGTS